MKLPDAPELSAVTALRHRDAFNQVRQHLQRLETVGQSLPVGQVVNALQVVTKTACQFLVAEAVFIGIHEPARHNPFAIEVFSQRNGHPREPWYAMMRSAGERLLLERQIIHEAQGAESPLSVVGFPLTSRGECLGALVVLTMKHPVQLTEDHWFLDVFVDRLSVALSNLRLRRRLTTTYWSTIQALNLSLAKHAPFLKGHSRRVIKYACYLGREAGLSPQELAVIRHMGSLHDVGKLAIASEIVNRPGPLTPEEWVLMKQHPIIGATMLEELTILREGIPLVRHHHERYDGQGYPDGLKGEEIPILARIFTIADAYDAMVSDRPYRKGLDVATIEHELTVNAGTQFDPRLLEIFLRIIKEARYSF